MRSPRSKFVRDKIVGLPFTDANVGYIGKLLDIEHYVVQGPQSFAEGMANRMLQETYPVDYGAIRRELRPGDDGEAKRAEAHRAHRLAAEKRRLARDDRDRGERDRELWLNLGGTV